MSFLVKRGWTKYPKRKNGRVKFKLMVRNANEKVLANFHLSERDLTRTKVYVYADKCISKVLYKKSDNLQYNTLGRWVVGSLGQMTHQPSV